MESKRRSNTSIKKNVPSVLEQVPPKVLVKLCAQLAGVLDKWPRTKDL